MTEAIITSLLLALLTVVRHGRAAGAHDDLGAAAGARRGAAGRVPLPAAADHPRAGDRGRHPATSTPGSTTSSATRRSRSRSSTSCWCCPTPTGRSTRPCPALDATTLAEAARSLGASWTTVIVRVIVPTSGRGILAAAFISVALVLGEYTISSLLHYNTLPVVIVLISKADAPSRWPRPSPPSCSPPLLLVGAVVPRPPTPHRPEGN